MLLRRKVIHIKIRFIRGQTGRKVHFIQKVGLSDKGAHRLISRKVQFDIKIGFIVI